MSNHNALQPQRPPRSERRPLLSVCTILILSGFLLGMSAGSQFTGEIRVLVSMAGLTGLVAFLGLDHVANRRRLQAERKEQEYVESRLVKHVISAESVVVNREELLSLARRATATIDFEELMPAGRTA